MGKTKAWDLEEKSSNKHVVGVKWVFKTKLNLDGTIQKHKAILVAKGLTFMNLLLMWQG